MEDAILDVQKELVSILNVDADLAELMGNDRVFDDVPQNEKPPFIAITRHDVLDNGTDDGPAWDHRITLSAFSNYRGRKEVSEILDRAFKALSLANFTLNEHAHIGVFFDRLETSQDVKGRYWRGALKLRILTEPN